MIALLDVNMLIALLDPQHVHHDPAINGLLNTLRRTGKRVRLLRTVFCAPGAPSLPQQTHHHFWADALSWSVTSAIRGDQVLTHGQITDVYLLTLAVPYHGMLVTLDSRINTRVVQGGQDALHLIGSSP